MNDLIEIRWHGRGGQGAKTASLLLADAAFNTGKYIQGFPEYGAERMGAPITAYNRISTTPIRIHCNIYNPDYVVVVDDTLLNSVDVTAGLKESGAIVINTTKDGETLKKLLKGYKGHIYTIDARTVSLETIGKIKGKNHSHYATNGSDKFHMPRHCSERDIQVIKEWISKGMNKSTQQEAIDFYKKVTGRTTLYRKYRNLEWDEPSPTVVAHLQKDGFMFIHPDINQARFITIREAALLMSFPMDYEFIGNRAYCYKMIGNAVPVNFAKAIAESLYRIL